MALAEDTGLIAELTRWSLNATLRFAAQASPTHGLDFSINISPRVFGQRDIVAQVTGALGGIIQPITIYGSIDPMTWGGRPALIAALLAVGWWWRHGAARCRRRGRRAAYHRHRAARIAAHRQPAARSLRTPR